jgi:dihydroorotase
VNPRKILGLPIPMIREGEKADLTIFDTAKQWTYDLDSNYSKSTNHPWMGKKLTGKVVGVIHNGKSFFSHTA